MPSSSADNAESEVECEGRSSDGKGSSESLSSLHPVVRVEGADVAVLQLTLVGRTPSG